MKKPVRISVLPVILLGIAALTFVAGIFALIFGVALVSLVLGAVLAEKWGEYQVPISKTLFFFLALIMIEVGIFLAALTQLDIIFFSSTQVITIGLITGAVLYSLGWFCGKYFH